VQVDAAFYDDQTETCAWTVTDVTPAMEGVKEPLLIGFWNSDALVTDGANNVRSGATDFELYRPAGLGILHRVGKQIREDVPEQAFVGPHLRGHFSD
jgi:hypothetical protein